MSILASAGILSLKRGPQTPAQILGSNLVAWYPRGPASKFDSIVGGSAVSADGTQIGRWEDASANAYHLVRPVSLDVGVTWVTGVTNLGLGTVWIGHGSVADGTMKVPNALGAALAAAGAGAIWLVLKAISNGTSVASGLWDFSATDNPTNYAWGDTVIYDGWGSTVRKTTGVQIIDISTAFRRYHVYSAAGDWTNYLNAAQQFHTNTNTVTFRSTALRIFAAALVWGGWVSEIVIAKVKPTSGQQSAMDTYLSTP